jgi:TetR/AcrR family transcriptional repressor of mexJK operon
MSMAIEKKQIEQKKRVGVQTSGEVISKRDQILAVAGQLFMTVGFHSLSMDKLAAAVPVSKPTLYAHFADKDALFAAVVEAKCQKALSVLSADMAQSDLDPVVVLKRFATNFVEMIYREESIQFHRVMTAEASRLPAMTRLFYESGPAKIRQLLVSYLKAMHKISHYEVTNPLLSADMFIGMIKGARHMRCVLGLDILPNAKEKRAMIAHAVALFLHGHTVILQD